MSFDWRSADDADPAPKPEFIAPAVDVPLRWQLWVGPGLATDPSMDESVVVRQVTRLAFAAVASSAPRPWRATRLGRALRVHSPSMHAANRCWCYIGRHRGKARRGRR